MRRLKRIALCMVIAALSLGLGGIASAHVLKQDNGLYGILHIQPDDSPSAGHPTQLVFYFGSNLPQYTFALSDCQCEARLIENGATLSTTPITSEGGSDTVGQAIVTFPKLAVYSIVVTAHPKDTAFPAFALTYPTRVDQSNTAPGQHSRNVIEYAILGLGILGLLAIAIWQAASRKRPPSRQANDRTGR